MPRPNAVTTRPSRSLSGGTSGALDDACHSLVLDAQQAGAGGRVNLAVAAARHADDDRARRAPQPLRQNAAMRPRRRIVHHQVAFLGPDADIDLAVRPHGDAARIHLRRVHAAQVFHLAGRRVEAHQLRVRIRAGVELAVLAEVVLPEIRLAGRRFADDFDALLRLPGIEPQDQPAVPRAEVDLPVRPGDQRPRARALAAR